MRSGKVSEGKKTGGRKKGLSQHEVGKGMKEVPVPSSSYVSSDIL